MLIAINASAAFKERRTGVEEYTYQLIRSLAELKESEKHQFLLYLPYTLKKNNFDFVLPENFRIKRLRWLGPMWTQVRLALEMLFNRPETLFIPVHILPSIHPSKSAVTIHGLEYEYYPEMYPANHLRYLRWSTKFALKKAQTIIVPSENTKKDLVALYGADPEKIKIVYHGVSLPEKKEEKPFPVDGPYILFIGRLEAKKNIQGLIEAFYLLKKKYELPHKLILVGQPGYSFDEIIKKARKHFTCLNNQIIFTGYLTKSRWAFYQEADVFLLPSFYEGFGLPILEAQAAGCPVITSNVSSMPEVAGQGAVLIDPNNVEEIAEAIYRVLSNKGFRNQLIKKGYQNVERFSWEKCARETLGVLTE